MSKAILPLALALALAPFASFAGDSTEGDAAKATADPAQTAKVDDFVLRRLTHISLVANEGDARQKAVNFLGSEQAHRDAYASLQQCRGCHGGGNAVNGLLDSAAIAR